MNTYPNVLMLENTISRKKICSYKLQGWSKMTGFTAFIELCHSDSYFLSIPRWSIYPSKFSAASLREMSVTLGTIWDDLLWDTEKGKQNYRPFHPVWGYHGVRAITSQIAQGLWLTERMQWCMNRESRGKEACAVLLWRARAVRLSPGRSAFFL